MRTDRNPEHWKLLVFYFNPEESRLFVAKRTGLPVTLNFAKPMAWAIVAATLGMVTTAAIVNNVR
jgi:uncharacterized membrane protein